MILHAFSWNNPRKNNPCWFLFYFWGNFFICSLIIVFLLMIVDTVNWLHYTDMLMFISHLSCFLKLYFQSFFLQLIIFFFLFPPLPLQLNVCLGTMINDEILENIKRTYTEIASYQWKVWIQDKERKPHVFNGWMV